MAASTSLLNDTEAISETRSSWLVRRLRRRIFIDCTMHYNGFAFEPEYTAEEVEERLRVDGEEVSSDDDSISIDVSEEDGWCTCEQCVYMENATERVCCQSISGTIGRKFDSQNCITLTVAFQDVCLNRNVLEAALGTWRHLTEQPLEIGNKSYRFIGYRQFIS